MVQERRRQRLQRLRAQRDQLRQRTHRARARRKLERVENRIEWLEGRVATPAAKTTPAQTTAANTTTPSNTTPSTITTPPPDFARAQAAEVTEPSRPPAPGSTSWVNTGGQKTNSDGSVVQRQVRWVPIYVYPWWIQQWRNQVISPATTSAATTAAPTTAAPTTAAPTTRASTTAGPITRPPAPGPTSWTNTGDQKTNPDGSVVQPQYRWVRIFVYPWWIRQFRDNTISAATTAAATTSAATTSPSTTQRRTTRRPARDIWVDDGVWTLVTIEGKQYLQNLANTYFPVLETRVVNGVTQYRYNTGQGLTTTAAATTAPATTAPLTTRRPARDLWVNDGTWTLVTHNGKQYVRNLANTYFPVLETRVVNGVTQYRYNTGRGVSTLPTTAAATTAAATTQPATTNAPTTEPRATHWVDLSGSWQLVTIDGTQYLRFGRFSSTLYPILSTRQRNGKTEYGYSSNSGFTTASATTASATTAPNTRWETLATGPRGYPRLVTRNGVNYLQYATGYFRVSAIRNEGSGVEYQITSGTLTRTLPAVATGPTPAAPTAPPRTTPRPNFVARTVPTRRVGALLYAWDGTGWYRVVGSTSTRYQLDFSDRAPGGERWLTTPPVTTLAPTSQDDEDDDTNSDDADGDGQDDDSSPLPPTPKTRIRIEKDTADTVASTITSLISTIPTADKTPEKEQEIEDAVNDVQQQHRQLSAQHSGLTAERNIVTQRIAEIQAILPSKQAAGHDTEALETELAQLLELLGIIDGELGWLAPLLAQLDPLLQELLIAEAEFKGDVVKAHSTFQADFEQDQAELTQAETDYKTASDKVTKEAADLQPAGDTLRTAAAALNTASAALSPIVQQLGPISNTLQGLGDAIDAPKARFESADAAFKKAEEEFNTAQGVWQPLNAARNAKIAQFNALGGELQSIGDDVAALDAQARSTGFETQADYDAYIANRKALTDKYDAKRGEYDTLLDAINNDQAYQRAQTAYEDAYVLYTIRLEGRNDALTPYNAAIEAYNAYKEKNYDSLYARYETAKSAYDTAKSAYDTAKSAYDTEKQEYDAAVDAANAAYDLYERKYNEAQESLAEWNAAEGARADSGLGNLPAKLTFTGQTETSVGSAVKNSKGNTVTSNQNVQVHLFDGPGIRTQTVVGGGYVPDEYVTVVGFDADGTGYYRDAKGQLRPVTEYTIHRDSGTVVRNVHFRDDGTMGSSTRLQPKKPKARIAHADGSVTQLEDGVLTVTDAEGNVVQEQKWGGTYSQYQRHQTAVARGEIHKVGTAIANQLRDLGVPVTWNFGDLSDPEFVKSLGQQLETTILNKQTEQQAQTDAERLEQLKALDISPEAFQRAGVGVGPDGQPLDNLITMDELDLYEKAAEEQEEIDAENYRSWFDKSMDYISSQDASRIQDAIDAGTSDDVIHIMLTNAIEERNQVLVAGAERLNEAIEEQNQLGETGVDINDLYEQENIIDPGVESNTYIVQVQTQFLQGMQKHGLGDLGLSVLATDDPETFQKYKTFLSQLDALADATQQQILTGYDETEYLDLGGKTDDEVVEEITQALKDLKDMGFEDPTLFLTSSMLPEDVQPSQIADYIKAVGRQAITGFDASEFTPDVESKTDDTEVNRIATWLKNKRLVGLGDEALAILSLPASEQPAAIEQLDQKHRQIVIAPFEADEEADIKEAEQLQIDARLATRPGIIDAFEDDEQADRVEQIANQQGLTGTVVIDGQVYFVTPEQQQAYASLSAEDRQQLAKYFQPGVAPQRLDAALRGAGMDGPTPKTPDQLDEPYQQQQQQFIQRREEFGDLGLTQSVQIGGQTYMVTPEQKAAFDRLSPEDQQQLATYFGSGVAPERLDAALRGAGISGPAPKSAAYWGVDPRAVERKNIADAIDEDRIADDPVYLDTQIEGLSWVRDLSSPRLHTSSPEEVLEASDRYGRLRTLRDGPNWIQNDDADARDEFRQNTYLGHDVGAPFVNVWRGIQYSQGLKYGQDPQFPEWAPFFNVPFDDAYWRVDAGTPFEVINPAYGFGAGMVDFGRDGYTEAEVALLVGLGLLEVGAAGALAKVPRGFIKLGDFGQAALGRRLSETAVFYGSNPIPVSWRSYVPDAPTLGIGWLPLPPRVPIAGSGRVSPLGALRVKTDAFGELVQPGGAYDIVRSIDPHAVPDADTAPFYRYTLDNPGVVSPTHDSARQILDTLNIEWSDTGQPFTRDFPIVGPDDANTLAVSYNPSPVAKVLGERIGAGPQFHSSPSAAAIVGDVDNPLSMLGDIGAPIGISPSLQDIRVTGVSGIQYEMPLPIKERPVRNQGWSFQPMPIDEQGGFTAGGTGIRSYVERSAFNVGAPSDSPGLIAINPRTANVQVSPASTMTAKGTPKTSIEFEGFTPTGDTWRAPRIVPESEADKIRTRANELHPDDPVNAKQVADEEIARRESGPVQIEGRDVEDPSYTSPPGDRRPSASVMIYDPKTNRVLLTQSAYGGPSRRGRWQSAGGLIDPGEEPWQSASREAFEETGARGRLIGTIHDNQALNHNFFLMEYTDGNVLPGGAGSHGELLDRRWVDLDDVQHYDLAFADEELRALLRLREYLRTGQLPEPLITPGRRMEAIPTGVTNPFADIPAQSTPTVQLIPIGIGTRARTPEGVRSPVFYNVSGAELSPSDVRRANIEAFKQWGRDPFGRWRVPRFAPDVERALMRGGRGSLTPAQRRSYNRTIAQVRERQRAGTIAFDSPGPPRQDISPTRAAADDAVPDNYRARAAPDPEEEALLRRYMREEADRRPFLRVSPTEGVLARQFVRRLREREEPSRPRRLTEDELLRLRTIGERSSRPGLSEEELNRLRRLTEDELLRLRTIGERSSRPGLSEEALNRLRRLTEDELLRLRSADDQPTRLQQLQRGARQRITTDAPRRITTGARQRITTDAPRRITTGARQRITTDAPRRITTGARQRITTDAPTRITTGARQRITTDAPTRITTGARQRITTDTPTRITTGARQRITTDAPTRITTGARQRITTDTPTRITTGARQRITTDAPTRITTGAPRRVTTDAPTRITTGAPRRVTTDAPQRTTTDSPGRSTTTPTNYTTTTPPNVTTITPPNFTTTTQPAPPPPRFNLQDGLRLRIGEYPREVEWFQGDLRFTQDLITGNRQVEFVEHPHEGKPSETFRVIATSRQIPNEQKIDLGDVDVHISKQGIQFRPSKTLRSPREPRRQDRVFRQRRVGAGAF